MRKIIGLIHSPVRAIAVLVLFLIFGMALLSACVPTDARQTASNPATPFTNIGVISPTRVYQGTASPTTTSRPASSPDANAIIPSPGSSTAPGSSSTPSPSPSASGQPSAAPSASATTTASPGASPSPSASAPSSPGSSASPGASAAGAVTINLTAQNISFDMKSITVKAGSQVTVNFNNKDSGIPHNFAAYTDSSASKSIFVGQIITGPATTTYTFTAPSQPGTYYFRCDVHPTQMNGQFIVQ